LSRASHVSAEKSKEKTVSAEKSKEGIAWSCEATPKQRR